MQRTRTALFLGLMTFGCGPEAAVDLPNDEGDAPTDFLEEEIAQERARLTGGTKVATADLPATGIVQVSAKGLCSGVLLTNRWVLTARHCFCQSHVNNPGSVFVTVYGSEASSEQPNLYPIYHTSANQVIRHTSLDVTLVRLKQTLPYTTSPKIYTGNGSDLPGKTVSAGGFGDNQLDGTGAGESLNLANMKIDTLGTAQASTTVFPNPCAPDPPETVLPSNGPRTMSLAGSTASTQTGDSGSPLFLEGGFDSRVLVGILSSGSTGPVRHNYTGLWHIRDWIRTSAPEILKRSDTPKALPNSTGAIAPAVALGPDGNVHIVARQTDGSLGHWRLINGSVTKIGTVPGANTGSAPAIGREATGTPRKLGLAFLGTSNQVKYARWSEAAGWSSPINVPSVTSSAGPAMSHGGLIAYVTGGRAAITVFDPATSTFMASQFVPAGAPTVDPSKRVSIIYDEASATGLIGYRTSANKWVQAFGSWSCAGTTGSYFCNADPQLGTTWSSGSLAYYPGQRVSLITTRKLQPTDQVAAFENRVVSGTLNYMWGMNRSSPPQNAQPGVATVGLETWVAYEHNGALAIQKADNSFANDW